MNEDQHKLIAEYHKIIDKWNEKNRIKIYLPGDKTTYIYPNGKMHY